MRAHKIAHFPEGSGGVVQDLSAVSRRCALQEKADLRQTGAITTSVLDCAQLSIKRAFLLSCVMSRDILTSDSCSVLLAWYDAARSGKNANAGESEAEGG